MAEIRRPAGLGDEEWQSIRECEDRLLGAKAASDPALVVGSAKELCESIARVVIAERGGTTDTTPDFGDVISATHKALDFQPGEGLASDPSSRRVAQGLKSLVLGLGEIRNRYGTGHGRAAPSGITQEHADLSFDAAMMWGGWALNRLEPYIAGDVTQLIRDLEGATFHGGTLAKRLRFADLGRQSEEDHVRLGVAVGRRASRGTFVVMDDGVAAVDPREADKWPAQYVHGLLVGLFFDPNGLLTLTEWKVKQAARLLAALPDRLTILQEVGAKAERAAAEHSVAMDEESRLESIQALEQTQGDIPESQAREHWEALAAALRGIDREAP